MMICSHHNHVITDVLAIISIYMAAFSSHLMMSARFVMLREMFSCPEDSGIIVHADHHSTTMKTIFVAEVRDAVAAWQRVAPLMVHGIFAWPAPCPQALQSLHVERRLCCGHRAAPLRFI
jgi:hypothetical protein